jgi:hypothetical protein
MASNKINRFGPVILSSTLTTNILNPAAAGANAVGNYTATASYIVLRHIRISNKTGSAATVSLWIGLTGANTAGTEFLGTALSIAANSAYDWYGMVRLDSTDFLVGGSGTASALTFEAEGEIGLS